MKNDNIHEIGVIRFNDIDVKIYYDKHGSDVGLGYCCWSVRNPDSYYQGIVYMGENGKITYPDDAVIPEQTESDKEMFPRYILIKKEIITDDVLLAIQTYLEKEYKFRNSI